MKKFDGILFTTDLDGTLLKDDKTISRENLDAIRYFQSEGGLFTFVTGRIPRGARHVAEQVVPNAPVVCIQGGGIYDFREEKLLWAVEMEREVFDLVEYIEGLFPTVGIELNVYDKVYFCKKNEFTEKHRRDEQLDDITCSLREMPEPFSKVLVIDRGELIPQIAEALHAHPLAEKFDFIRSDTEYYEILVKGTNKGRGLLKLCELLSVDSRRTIAVGDNDNDETLLKTAKVGFAVSNASPAALAASDRVTVSNEESAIARIIEELDCGKLKI